MAIGKALVGLGVLGIAGLGLAFAGDDAKADTKPTGGGGGVPPELLSCDGALATLKAKGFDVGPATALLGSAKTDVNAKSAAQLATSLELLAEQPKTPVEVRPAMQKIASCLRDYYQNAGGGAGGTELLSCDDALKQLPKEMRDVATLYLSSSGPKDADAILKMRLLATSFEATASQPAAASMHDALLVAAQCLRIAADAAEKAGGKGGAATPPGPLPEIPVPPLKPGDVIYDESGVPSALGGTAVKGKASNPAFQWLYAVQDGDSAFAIATKVFGAGATYQRVIELIDNNPREHYSGRVYKTQGDRNNPNTTKFNFSDATPIRPGDRLEFPKSWNRWIDQQGFLRHDPAPFPT
jgi:hypothetical protein